MGIVARREQRLSREIPVVIVLVGNVAVGRQLIAGIRHTAIRGPIADRVIRKSLWIEQQRMARAGQPIQLIVAEGLRATSVSECGPIADGVVDVLGLIDRRGARRQLVQDVGHLTGGIVVAGRFCSIA